MEAFLQLGDITWPVDILPRKPRYIYQWCYSFPTCPILSIQWICSFHTSSYYLPSHSSGIIASLQALFYLSSAIIASIHATICLLGVIASMQALLYLFSGAMASIQSKKDGKDPESIQ